MPNPAPKHASVKITKGYVDRIKPGPTDEFHWCVDPRKPPARITRVSRVLRQP